MHPVPLSYCITPYYTPRLQSHQVRSSLSSASGRSPDPNYTSYDLFCLRTRLLAGRGVNVIFRSRPSEKPDKDDLFRDDIVAVITSSAGATISLSQSQLDDYNGYIKQITSNNRYHCAFLLTPPAGISPSWWYQQYARLGQTGASTGLDSKLAPIWQSTAQLAESAVEPGSQGLSSPDTSVIQAGGCWLINLRDAIDHTRAYQELGQTITSKLTDAWQQLWATWDEPETSSTWYSADYPGLKRLVAEASHAGHAIVTVDDYVNISGLTQPGQARAVTISQGRLEP